MESNHNPVQNERVINYLRDNESITQIEALSKLGIMRLASRISDLKKLGYQIVGEMITVKNRFGENCRVKQYKLIESEGEKHGSSM